MTETIDEHKPTLMAEKPRINRTGWPVGIGPFHATLDQYAARHYEANVQPVPIIGNWNVHLEGEADVAAALREVDGLILAKCPRVLRGTYLSGRGAAKSSGLTKFPADAVAYELIAQKCYTGQIEADRHTVNIADEDCADWFAQALTRAASQPERRSHFVFLDEINPVHTGWRPTVRFLGDLRDRLHKQAQQKLVVNVAFPVGLTPMPQLVELGEAVDGILWERLFAERKDFATCVRELRWFDILGYQGKLLLLIGSGPNGERTVEERTLCAAVAMLCWQPQVSCIYVSHNYQDAPEPWVDNLSPAVLGQPTQERHIEGVSFVREFEHGTLVVYPETGRVEHRR